jgi:seryl-tRNA synthetase
VLDLRFIRENLDLVRENCRNRNFRVDLERLVELDEARRRLQTDLDEVRRRRNDLAKELKARRPTDEERALGRELKEREGPLEAELASTTANLADLHGQVPNLTHPDAPVGADESANRELRRSGTPPRFEFEPRDHVELGTLRDLIDFEAGAKVTGQKFYFLKNQAVLLEQALIRFALEHLWQRGFTLFQTPDLARADVSAGIGYNPRGEETQVYSIANDDLVLIGTAEITLGGMHKDDVLELERLPLRYCGVSHCFRTEAGAAGRAGRGLYRVHQFSKVEMFAFTHPDASEAMHGEFVRLEEELYQGLEIPYRVVDVCTGDLGAPAYRKFDLEAWMPGRSKGGSFGEITSTSNCTDYQARRLNVRFRDAESGKLRFVHMLNGTAIAMSRTLIALLENHQRADGSIEIPKALRPYTGFDRIG